MLGRCRRSDSFTDNCRRARNKQREKFLTAPPMSSESSRSAQLRLARRLWADWADSPRGDLVCRRHLINGSGRIDLPVRLPRHLSPHRDWPGIAAFDHRASPDVREGPGWDGCFLRTDARDRPTASEGRLMCAAVAMPHHWRGGPGDRQSSNRGRSRRQLKCPASTRAQQNGSPSSRLAPSIGRA